MGLGLGLGLGSGSGLGLAKRLDLPHELHALLAHHLAEDHVLPVEPSGLDGRDEELATVAVGTGVGHREHARPHVCQVEVLIGKLLAIDRLAARAVSVGEVAALQREVWDDVRVRVRVRGRGRVS